MITFGLIGATANLTPICASCSMTEDSTTVPTPTKHLDPED